MPAAACDQRLQSQPDCRLFRRSRPAILSSDPRLGVPPDEPALKAFRTRTPLLVVGSHAWNKPYNDAGDMVCGSKQQAAILAAASAGR